MNVSMLVPYSYGIVAANKPRNSYDIEVTPMEALTMTNGELTDNISTNNAKGKDADGSSFETTVKSSATVTARWLPFGSNRKTAPDVRRGEKVEIYKFADADKYYWASLEYEPKLRKLETIIFALSDTRVEADDATPSNTYFLEISTHDKLVHFHTSTSDGEPVGYDFMLNTKDAVFQIVDTVGNIIFLDSTSKRITLKNAAETSIDMNAEDLIINVPKNMTTTVGGNMTTHVVGSVTLFADGGLTTKAPNVDFITPKMTTSAVFQSGGKADIGGPLTVAGTGSFSGNVSAPNI